MEKTIILSGKHTFSTFIKKYKSSIEQSKLGIQSQRTSFPPIMLTGPLSGMRKSISLGHHSTGHYGTLSRVVTIILMFSISQRRILLVATKKEMLHKKRKFYWRKL